MQPLEQKIRNVRGGKTRTMERGKRGGTEPESTGGMMNRGWWGKRGGVQQRSR